MSDLFQRAGDWLRGQATTLDEAYERSAQAQMQSDAAHREALQRIFQRDPTAGAPKKSASPALRGPVWDEAPPPAPTPHRYLADLSKPEKIGALSRSAGGGRAYIEPFPASNLGVEPWSDAELISRMRSFAAGGPVDRGPQITFVNDNPRNPSPNLPLTPTTARMTGAAVLQSGLDTVNINSTTGGGHSPRSRHYGGMAVDVNRVNGQRVDADPVAAAALQNAFAAQPDIRENCGPTFQHKTPFAGGTPVAVPAVRAGHRNHIHASSQR